MTVIQGTALDSGQQPSPYAKIKITLVTGTPTMPGYSAAGELIGPHQIVADVNGAWSANLTPNDQITPANTYYKVTENLGTSTIVVPDSGGPYKLNTVLATPPPTPGSLGITGVQVAANGTVAGSRPEVNLIAGTNVTITGADNPGSSRVDVTISATGGGGGGGGTPASTVQPGTAYGVASAVGTGTSYAREDHQHGTVSLTTSAPSATEGIGQSAAVGTASTPARADHVHPMAAAGTPGSSAVGDAAAAGVATTFAASDHKHGREAFGAVTPQTAYGAASANGTSGSVAHADHTHGTPSLTTTAPSTTLAIGTAAALGAATLPALADHVHPMAAAAAPSASAVGDTSTTGSATTFAASDHRHSREAFGAVTAQTSYGAASANGSATTVSHSDHTHGTPALPTTAQIGAANRLTPTAVKTAAYTAQAGDLVPVDATAGNVAITLVSAPADGTVIAVKMIATASSHTTTVTCGGTDVYNKAGGATVATLSLTAQAILLQYFASSGIWYVVGDDLPLTQLDARYVAKSSPVNLTDGATIATDASLGGLFRVTLGGNRTLSNPTNGTDGQLITWSVKQDATGSRTLTLDTKFRVGTDITSITLTTTPGKTDHIGARYNSGDDKWDVIAFVRGF